MTPAERITMIYGMPVAWVEAVNDEQTGHRYYYVGFIGDEHANGYRSTEYRDYRTCLEIINYERKIRGYGPIERRLEDRDCRKLVGAFNNYLNEMSRL